MKKIILIGILASQYLFGLVSIVPVEIGKQPGISGTFEVGLETKRGNTDKDKYKASTRITYDNNESYVAWAELSGEYGRSKHVTDTSEVFSHLRYVHSLTNDENLRYELFVQLENDKFKEIRRKMLGGGGLRYRVLNFYEGGKGYLGFGGFFESVKYTDPDIDPSEDNVRLNSYFAYTFPITDMSTISYVLYYQPKIDDFSDNILSNELELKLNIVKTLFLKFNVSMVQDSDPAVDVKKYEFIQTTTFLYKF